MPVFSVRSVPPTLSPTCFNHVKFLFAGVHGAAMYIRHDGGGRSSRNRNSGVIPKRQTHHAMPLKGSIIINYANGKSM